MQMTLWRIEIRGLGLAKIHRHEFSLHVATKGMNETDAVRLARARFSPEWWDEHIIKNVVEIGRLAEAEGLDVPQNEVDY